MNIEIVGANRGIGLEFCRQLSKDSNVFAFCRKASSELREVGATQIIEGAEVTDLSSMQEAVEQMSADKIDWLVHVSGVLSSESLADFDVERIKHQFAINSVGPILSYQAFSKHMATGSKYAVLSSRMGSVADNGSGGMYGYRMSKAAINMAAVSLSNDIKPKGITVLILHPGYVRTEMTGGQGLIDTNESVLGLLKIIKTKSLEDTGTFWHTNGEQLPW